MIRILFLIAGLVVVSGCSDDDQKTGEANADSKASGLGFDTPQAAFVAADKAADAKDWKTFAECLDAESQEMICRFSLIPLSLMAATDESLKRSVEELVAKHGIDMNPSGESPAAGAKDKVAFIADALAFTDKHAGKNTASTRSPLGDVKLVGVEINGDTAKAKTSSSKPGQLEIEFRKVNGRWFVHLGMPQATMTVGDGNNDFGNDFNTGSSGRFGSGFGNDKPAKPLVAIPVDGFDKSWRTDYSCNNRPAADALAELSKQLGLKFTPDANTNDLLAKPVSVSIQGKSRFEAIEQICKQAGASPDYSNSELRVKSGARVIPAVHAGPFVLFVEEFNTNPKYATGTLTLTAFTTGINPLVVASLSEMSSDGGMHFDKIEDAKGNNVLHTTTTSSHSSPRGSDTIHRQYVMNLKNLLSSVNVVKTISGSFEILLPTRVESTTFESPATGTEKLIGETKLRIKSVNGGRLKIEFENADADNIQILAYDGQGQPMTSRGNSHFSFGTKGAVEHTYQSAPSRVVANVITSTEKLEFPYAFSDIAVPNSDQMPTSLPALAFDGDAPVSLEFLRIGGENGFRRVIVKVTNLSNKDMHSAAMGLAFKDASGKVLKKTESHCGDMVEAGKSKESEVIAFFMPEETQSVDATLKAVTFADAAGWQVK